MGVRFVITLAAALLPSVVYAGQCPSAESARKGFLLLQEDVQSEFRSYAGPVVQIINRNGTSSKQTVFSFRGLIDLSRMGTGDLEAIYLLSDLDKIFPLKKDARHSFSFVMLDPKESHGANWTYDLAVTGRETFSLEGCNYDVFRIRQTLKKDKKQVDTWSALYSPQLQATLAKIYDEGTAGEYTVSYKRIRLLQR